MRLHGKKLQNATKSLREVKIVAFFNHNILSTGGVRERKSHRLNGKTKKVNKKQTSAGLLYYIRFFYDLAEHVCLLVGFCK